MLTLDAMSGAGPLRAAIDEFTHLLEERPDDVSVLVLLGELHARANDPEAAIGHLLTAANAVSRLGDRRKAAAICWAALAIQPESEDALLRLGAFAAEDGNVVEACRFFDATAERRAERGDRRGAAELRIRIAELSPDDLDAQIAGADAKRESGDKRGALEAFKTVGVALMLQERFEHAQSALESAMVLGADDDEIRDALFSIAMRRGDLSAARGYVAAPHHAFALAGRLEAEGRLGDVLPMLKEVALCHPDDAPLRAEMVRRYLVDGDVVGAADCLTADMAENNLEALFAVAEIQLRAGKIDAGQKTLNIVAARAPSFATEIARLGCEMARHNANDAWRIVDEALTIFAAAGEWLKVIPILKEFLRHDPDAVPALLRLVEAAVEGDAEVTASWAQAQLVDAYLKQGDATAALAVAQDLADREPTNPEHQERIARASASLEPAVSAARAL